MGYHRAEASSSDDIKGVDGLSDRTYLVDFQEEIVACFIFDCFSCSPWVCHEEIVSDYLHFMTDLRGERSVCFPIILVEGVFDGEDGVFIDEGSEVFNELCGSLAESAARSWVFEVQIVELRLRVVEFTRCDVH